MGEMRNLIHVHLLHPIRKEKGHEKTFFPQCLSLIFALKEGFIFLEHVRDLTEFLFSLFLRCPLCCVNKTLSLPASEAGEVALMHCELPVSLWWTKCAWQHAS